MVRNLSSCSLSYHSLKCPAISEEPVENQVIKRQEPSDREKLVPRVGPCYHKQLI